MTTPGFEQTNRLWREIRDWRAEHYPDTVLIPEGSEPQRRTGSPAVRRLLPRHPPPHSSLFNNGGAGALPGYDPAPCYFDAEGQGSTGPCLRSGPLPASTTRPADLLAPADHDYSRLACGVARPGQQLGAAYTFLLTWGTIPSDLLRRRDRHALSARAARQGGQHRPPDVQPGGAVAPRCSGTGRRTPASRRRRTRPTSTYRSTRTRTGPRSQRSWSTVTRSCTWCAGWSRCAGRPRARAWPATPVLHAGYPFVYRRGDHTWSSSTPAAAGSRPRRPEHRSGPVLAAPG